MSDDRLRPTVLVLDDEPIILMSLRIEIRNHFADKIRVVTAEGPEEFLEEDPGSLRLGDCPCLAIVDGVMSGPLGCNWVLIPELHRQYPNMAFIAVGDSPNYMNAELQKIATFVAYVCRPYRKEELMGLIAQGLELSVVAEGLDHGRNIALE